MEQRSVRTLRSTCFSIASIPPQLLTDSQRRDFWRRLPRNQLPLSLCWEDWRCVRPYGNECRAEHLREPSATLILCHHQYRSEEHTSELQSLRHLVCRLLLE